MRVDNDHFVQSAVLINGSLLPRWMALSCGGYRKTLRADRYAVRRGRYVCWTLEVDIQINRKPQKPGSEETGVAGETGNRGRGNRGRNTVSANIDTIARKPGSETGVAKTPHKNPGQNTVSANTSRTQREQPKRSGHCRLHRVVSCRAIPPLFLNRESLAGFPLMPRCLRRSTAPSA